MTWKGRAAGSERDEPTGDKMPSHLLDPVPDKNSVLGHTKCQRRDGIARLAIGNKDFLDFLVLNVKENDTRVCNNKREVWLEARRTVASFVHRRAAEPVPRRFCLYPRDLPSQGPPSV